MHAVLSLLLFAILTHSVHAKPLVPLFQVVTGDLCLTLDSRNGLFRRCDSSPDNSVFFITGSTPNQHSIHIQNKGKPSVQCLDREHCHSGESNLRASSCSHCGAIHWNINPVSDVFSTLSEDSGSNCIYRDGQTARVRHCSDGPGYFQIKYVGLVDIEHPSNETKLM